jgi:hypothetical protein
MKRAAIVRIFAGFVIRPAQWGKIRRSLSPGFLAIS